MKPVSNRRTRRLSLAMIVKNEAQTLEKCLSLARPHVDEIVVVDTGSTDGTQEIARRYADVFEEIPWPESFSAARNYSFDKATGDYILVLDGDEYIEDQEGWAEIRRQLQRPKLGALMLSIYNVLPEGQILAADRIMQERVIVNVPEVRYDGRVHNQITERLQRYCRKRGKDIFQLHVDVVHTGYALSTDRMKTKYAARESLLRLEYEKPMSEVYRAYYGYQLGVVLYIQERFEEALQIFDAIDYSLMAPANAVYTHLLGTQTALRCDNAGSALVHANGFLNLERNEPIGYYSAGLALIHSGRYLDGLMMLLEAYNIAEVSGKNARFAVSERFMLQAFERVCRGMHLEPYAAAFALFQQNNETDTPRVKALIKSMQQGLALADREA